MSRLLLLLASLSKLPPTLGGSQRQLQDELPALFWTEHGEIFTNAFGTSGVQKALHIKGVS
eukprot:6785575-Prymnesium_polylepis.1